MRRYLRSAFASSLAFLFAGATHAADPARIAFVASNDTVGRIEAKAIVAAGDIVNAVKNSDCFRTFMETRALLETNGRSPKEVAAHLRGLSGEVSVAFYFRCLAGSPYCSAPTSAVAYRLPPGDTVFMNRAYYNVSRNAFDLYEFAGSLAHEAIGHALGGYGHTFEWTARRDLSVPYSISGASPKSDDAFRHCRKPLGYGEWK